MLLKKKELALVLGTKLRKIRLNKGISMEKLAHEAGMEYVQLSRIELGKINTSLYQLYVLSNTLNLPLPAFFEDLNEKEHNGADNSRQNV